MNVIFRIMVYSIILNLATGIMLTMIVDRDGNQVFDVSHGSGLTFSSNYTDGFTELQGDVSPTGTVEDAGDAIYRVLDTLTLGFIGRIIKIGETYGYGFIVMLENIFGGMLGENSKFFFGLLKVIMTIGYILGGLWLWTGKNLNENT